MKAWVKGGLIGGPIGGVFYLISGIILQFLIWSSYLSYEAHKLVEFVLNIIIGVPLSLTILICRDCLAGGLGILMVIIFTFIYGVVMGAIIGAIIGWIVGLIKARKQ